MRKLTIAKRIDKYNAITMCQKFGVDSMPNYLFKLLENYAGLRVKECIYDDKINNTKWVFGGFYDEREILGNMEELEEEREEEENFNKVIFPLGREEIGWLFGISFDEEDYLAVYLFKSSDYVGDKPLIKVSDSLEEFINGLRLLKKNEVVTYDD